MPAERERRAPVPGPLGRLAERAYVRVVSRRNRAFDEGSRVTDVGVPVVSVGNLSVGGTGKSPFTAWLVRALEARGLHAAIAMRGYGARAPREHGPPVSDEQAEYERLLPGTPIVAQPDRVAGVRALLASDPSVECIVLDDGFQHRFVKRDVDIVLIDATRDPFDDRCLPAGWLREPTSSLARAHTVVLMRADLVEPSRVRALRQNIAHVAPRALVAVARHGWAALETDEGDAPVASLRGRTVHIVCAIGNPDAFIAQARSAGANVVSFDARQDHAPYTARIVRAIERDALRSGASLVLTTMKDWVKIGPLLPASPTGAAGESGAPPPPIAPFVRPRVEIVFDEGEEALKTKVFNAVVVRGRSNAEAANAALGAAGVLRS